MTIARKSRKTSKTTAERQAQAKMLRDRLTQWQADADPALIALALARHDGYSERNAMLIAMADPDATDVRGYRTWQSVGRQVGRYPEGEGGIAIVSYRGDGKTKEQREAAEAAKQPGEVSSDDLKASRYFALATVHDVRWTFPLKCAAEECGLPIHLTGYDKDAKQWRWTHTGRRNVGHEAEQPRPTGEVMVPKAPEAPVPVTLDAAEE